MKLSIATPQNVIFEGEVSSLTAPGTLGYFQILENHAPLLTTLTSGQVTAVTHDKTISYTISGGFLEVARNEITLLADSVNFT